MMVCYSTKRRIYAVAWIAFVLVTFTLIVTMLTGCVYAPSQADLDRADRLQLVVDTQQQTILDQQNQIRQLQNTVVSPDSTPEEVTNAQTALARLLAEQAQVQAEIDAKNAEIARLKTPTEGPLPSDVVGGVAPFLPPPFNAIAGVVAAALVGIGGITSKRKATQ